jgi:NNP family nitrate/nitrite transporter-like MFS transporter
MTQTTAANRQGHTPTLLASFLHFDVSFMLWVLLGALGIYIAEDLGLSPMEKGLVVGVPILSGSLLRLPAGLLSDRLGAKKVGVALLAFLFVPLGMGWLTGDSLPQLLGVGLLLGVAGASFAVALPLASRWYSPERQGLVMGIAAAGNSGTIIANLLAPRLAEVVGWHNVLALAMAPLALVLAAFLLMAKDPPPAGRAPEERSAGVDRSALRSPDLWWICLLYAVTFGGYVGWSSFLPILLRDQYGVSPITAGYLTAIAALAGSGVRPLGGYLADRFGGVPMLLALLPAIGLIYIAAAQLPALGVLVGLLIAGMACLGMGNGAVFQLVPGRFPRGLGLATGVVGAAGGLGGFLLPSLLGAVREASGSFGPGLAVLAGMAFLAVVPLGFLAALSAGWRASWRAKGATPILAPARRVLMAAYLGP